STTSPRTSSCSSSSGPPSTPTGWTTRSTGPTARRPPEGGLPGVRRPGTAAAGAAARSGGREGGGQLVGELGPSSGLVVPEEDVGIEPSVEARPGPGGPNPDCVS